MPLPGYLRNCHKHQQLPAFSPSTIFPNHLEHLFLLYCRHHQGEAERAEVTSHIEVKRGRDTRCKTTDACHYEGNILALPCQALNARGSQRPVRDENLVKRFFPPSRDLIGQHFEGIEIAMFFCHVSRKNRLRFFEPCSRGRREIGRI